jgi:hypothetical protein
MTNLKFLNFPVAAQAVLLIAALGVLSIAANWFCLERLDEINRLNATVNCHFAPAPLALAEAKAASESFGVAVYKDYFATDLDHTGAGIGDARRREDRTGAAAANDCDLAGEQGLFVGVCLGMPGSRECRED